MRKNTSKKKIKKKRKKKSCLVQVGKTRITAPHKENPFTCKYSDVPVSPTGWVTNPNYLPISFDMMELRVKQRDKTVPGWWDDKRWQGLHFKKEYTVTAWKRMPDYD